MPEIKLGNTTVTYTKEINENEEFVNIIIDPTKGVIIKTPKKVPENEIQEILKKKGLWVLQKLEKINSIAEKPSKREFVSGEKLPYLGRHYRLKVYKKTNQPTVIKWRQGKFFVYINSQLDSEKQRAIIFKSIAKWYIEHAEKVIAERTVFYAPRVGKQPSQIKIKEQKLRWGSCTKNGGVNFNWRIIMSPLKIVDYVVVHELCHLIFPYHSHQFWNRMGAVLADYEKRREWLRINGPKLDL